jgi:hypothetical protein
MSMTSAGRKEPRISINKLGEYLTATPSRRRQIIRDQKFPPTFQVARYTDAEKAIVECLLSDSDDRVLQAALDKLAGARPQTPWEKQQIELCEEAIVAFREIDDLDLAPFELSEPRGVEALTFAQVTVNVRPNLVLSTTSKTKRAGALKLYLSKTHPLTDVAAEYICAVTHAHAEERSGGPGSTDHRGVFVVDVFARRVFVCPRATARRLKDVEAACEEIAVRWPALSA